MAFYKQPKNKKNEFRKFDIKINSIALYLNGIFTSLKKAAWDIVILKQYIFLWRVLSGLNCCFCSQTKVIYTLLLEITKIPTMIGNMQTFQTCAPRRVIHSFSKLIPYYYHLCGLHNESNCHLKKFKFNWIFSTF